MAHEAELKNMVVPYLSLDEASDSSGQAFATQAVTSVVEALNFVSGDLWTNLHQNKINNLLELGLCTSVVVSILSLPICFTCTLCPPLFPHSIFIFLPQSILNLLQYDLVRESRETNFQAQIAETMSAAEAMTKTHAEQLELLAKHANDLEKSWGEEKARTDEAEQGVKVLQQTLELAKINDAKVKVILDNLCTENGTLKAEVQRLHDLRAEDKANLAQKIDDAIEIATDKTLYRIWSTNPGVLDLAFLREELEPTMARWKIWLEQEAEETAVKAVGNDGEEEIESYDLKTAQVRLDALKKNIVEASQETVPAEPATEDTPAAENAVYL